MHQTEDRPADEFTQIEITITDHVMVPRGSTIIIAPTGAPTAIRLPDGAIIKPWITYELDGDEECTDLTYDQLVARNFHAEQREKDIAEI